jgi:AcrR family transcriptional regulator
MEATRVGDTSQADSTRQRLLDAASEVFLEKGYEGTRVAEIARRAGLTTGAIYGNFESKADLLTAALGAVVDAALAKSSDEVARLMAALPDDDQTSAEEVRTALELMLVGSVVLRGLGREVQFPPDSASVVAVAATRRVAAPEA